MQALACPRCFSTLTQMRCNSCAITYSQLGDVFWLWPDPVNALLDWRNRYNMELARIDRDVARTRASDRTSSTTRERVSLERKALEQYKAELSNVLANLNLSEPLAIELHTALKTQLPDHHGLDSYNRNIFRDWVWGMEENQAVQQLLLETLSGHTKSTPAMLALGAGAGRLAYDLHAGLNARCTYALDSNPLLCAVAGSMFKGESSSLTEFPIAPLGTTAIQHTLHAPPPRDAIHSICGNALAAPFNANEFDLVLTSWLVDVVDASLSDLLAHVSSLLKPGGLWLMHGSVSFESSDPNQRISTAELAEMAGAAGFEIIMQRDDELPYLQSPYSRQKRTEVVHTLLASAPSPPTTRPVQDTWMPNWLADISIPVPMNDEFQEQLTTTRIATFIMGLIDGKKSIADMAVVLEEQRLMPKLDATEAIRNFLTTMQTERSAQQRKG